jgi:mannan endo-1,4-beta-mannosidase
MWVIAYYPNWWWGTLDPQNLDWTGMTHMVLFTGSGISTSSPYFSSTGLSGTALTNTISTAHSHGVKILLSLASVYPGSNWNAIASDNSKIDSLVSSAVAFAKANNFDGIELDIEWPSAMAPHDYLMDKLRAALDAWPTRGILVSAIDMAPFHSAYDPVVMNRDLDMMFAMTYTSWVNCGGPVAGFGTPVYKSTQFPNLQGCTLNDNAIDFITQGYDPSKMAISVTFEAIRMGGSAQKPGDAFSKSNWSFTQARNDMRSSNTAVINYDDSAKAAWSYWNGDYYDLQTPQSISEVVAWTKQHNFGGMMAYDTPAGWLPSKTGTAANPLWEALVSAVNNPSTPSGTASYCTPNAVQTTTQCNVCNSAGTAYAPSTAACSGQACTSGMCTVAATSPYCTPNAVQSGTTCNVCNSAGTAYIPTVSKCSSGQTCNSAGACVSSSVCTAPSCNGVQYCLNGQWASCASGQTCNAGACVSSVICTFGTTKTGTTCLSCNAAGTSYVVDSTKCASGQTCNSVGACITSGTGTWNGGVPVGSTIPVAGGNYFLLGTNYPWKSFDGDFGSGSIKVGSSYETDMTKLQGYGVHVVRWWLFPHGGKDYGFITYSGGAPTGLTSKFYTDMDGAIAIAKKYNLYLVPVFLSFDTANSNANLFDNGPNTQAFIDNVVVPIMQHYPNEPRILAWEIMNEPEGAISDGPLGGGAWTSTKISGASFYNIASKICAAVHQYTTSYCTTGSNGVDFLQYYMDSYTSTHNLPQLHFDFYEAHYYGYGSNVYSTAVSSIKGGIDHPVVIGEIDGTTVSTSNFDKLLANGYAGVWPWAYAPDTKAIPWNTFTAWANAHTAAINIPAAN